MTLHVLPTHQPITQPMHDRVLVQVDAEPTGEQTTTAGIIVVRPTVEHNPVRSATVLAVGSGEILYDGKIRKLSLEKGDRVLCHLNDVLPIESFANPSEPIIGIISERQVLAKMLPRTHAQV